MSRFDLEKNGAEMALLATMIVFALIVLSIR